MPFLSRISTFTFNKDTFFSSGGFTLVKNLLLFINFLSLLAGVILIGGGAYIQVNAGTNDLIDLSGSTAAAAIGIGVLITAISFFGIFGAANEKGMLLKTYFGLLLLLVVFELGLGIAAYAKSDAVEELLQTSWINSVASGNAQALNNIQHVERVFQCCGFRNTTQYAVPPNCATPASFDFHVPCMESVKKALQGSLATIGGTGLALGLVELIGLVFSVLLFVKIAQKDPRERESDERGLADQQKQDPVRVRKLPIRLSSFLFLFFFCFFFYRFLLCSFASFNTSTHTNTRIYLE